VWHGGAGNGLHYFGLFWEGMPDLNLRSADATAAVHEFSRFWLTEMRADGFRLDAAKHLIEAWPRVENTDATIEWLEGYRAAVREASPGAFVVGEVWSGSDQIARYIPGALDAAFEFDLAFAIVEGVRDGDAGRIARAIGAVQAAYPSGQYATFLANHDMQRVMTTLREGAADEAEALAKAKLAATIQFTLPGIPFIYYGEEIGMTGAKPDPDLRTPMQWTGDVERAGFTAGAPWREPHADTVAVNVESQVEDSESLLSHYRRLIRLRKPHEAFCSGPVAAAHSRDGRVLAYQVGEGTNRVVVVANCSSGPLPMREVSVSEAIGEVLRRSGANGLERLSGDGDLMELAAWSARIIQLPEE
jgi:glycosidase